MALDSAGLEADLAAMFASPPPAILDTEDDSEPPVAIPGCADAWADAMEAYASGIIPPSVAVSSAAASLKTALAAAFATPAAAPGMEAAFSAFAASVGAGMAGWTPTPPAGPVGFALQFAALPTPTTRAAAAATFATMIDDWMTTGTATLVAPPNTVVTWS